MDNPVCASCHKGLSLEEIERGSFKQLAGRLYCAECVAKMRRVGPVLCAQCGTQDTPLYDGKHYTCRKCGAQVQRSSAAHKTPAQRPAKAAARKKCPYCGAVLAAESLKCRYCGSSLTREARDLGSVTTQNLRLRFWLGCLLTASVFLLCLLVYLLVAGVPGDRTRAAAPPMPLKPATVDPSAALAATAADLQSQIAALKDELARARAAAPTTSAAPTPRPETSVPPERRVAPPAPKPSTTAVAVKKPATKVAPEPAPPAPPEPKGQDLAQRAAAAYPGLQETLKALRAEHNFAGAIAACRQFLAVYVDTAHGKRVAADQKALHAQLERVRDDHIAEFRDALAKGDVTAARAVVARLGRYNAPEIRDDRARMSAEIQAVERQPERNRARYLAQWDTPTHIARLLTQLRRRDDRQARANAAKELGRHQHPSAISGLLLAVDDPDWYTANCAIKALGDMGNPVALPDMARRTKASHPGVYDPAAQACRLLAAADRKEQAEAWGLVDAKAVSTDLIEALTLIDKEESNVTSRFRIGLIDTLALLDAKQAVPAIRAIRTRTADEAVRAAADAAVAKLTGADVTAKAPPPPPKSIPPEKPGPGKPAPPAPTLLPKPDTPPAPKPEPPKPAPPTKAGEEPKPKPAPPKPATVAPPAPKPEPPKPEPPKPAPPTKAGDEPKPTPTPPKPKPAPPKPTTAAPPKPAPPKPAEKPTPPPEAAKDPAPKPPAKPAVLSGTVQPSGDPQAVTLGLPADHGLAEGDQVELATGGRPLCVVRIAKADKTRVVATILKLLDKTPPAPDTLVSVTRAK